MGARLTTVARLGLTSVLVLVVFLAVGTGVRTVTPSPVVGIVGALVAALVSLVLVIVTRPLVDRVTERLAPDHRTPYAALAAAVGHFRDGALDEALPGLARVLVEGAGAQQARVWLARDDALAVVATHPPSRAPETDRVTNAEMLLARDDVDHAVPVLEGPSARAWLTIAKPDGAVVPADRRLMGDLADGASLLLRGLALTGELEQRIRRADELGSELADSQHRLRRARDLERRRLVAELDTVIINRLVRLRGDLATLEGELAVDTLTKAGIPSKVKARTATKRSLDALAETRTSLDDLLDHFRIIVRGVYPSVLRDQGPRAALEEVATDLGRPVRLDGSPGRRLTREVESGIYYVAAAAMQQLADRPGPQPLRVHLTVNDGRFSVLVVDQEPPTGIDDLRSALGDETDRLEALGGVLNVEQDQTGATRVWAWLPTDLQPATQIEPGLGAEQAVPAGAGREP
ncbi:hypothetical protein LQ327_22690 [Actinomycetospora endophytica]|uniref:Signal transduction histidine kinase n=1 Tax=Actinomycetospora endophytica TaxID=2291215 RepID=A0ABS8PD29_9PSEU|nr:hypothetical protein [Actinomycetospora endophytica]MCD2196185.1 hypothetical protein [Actinomycetospora endophytica]